MSEQKYASWNPWHGCTKYSEGCRYCYVYRQDEAYGRMYRIPRRFQASQARKAGIDYKIADGFLPDLQA